MGSRSAPLDSLRRPAYTGAQRCLPCTVLNVGVLAVSVLALAHRKRRVSALALAAVGAGAIWLRGYFLPYTPWFAPRLVARIPLLDGVFHASDDRTGVPDGPSSLADAGGGAVADDDGVAAFDAGRDETTIDGDGNADAILERLLASGVLVAEGEDLSLAPEVSERWQAEIRSLRSLTSERLATEALETAPTATDARVIDGDRPDEDGRWIALGDGDAIATETWLSRPVAIAEVAAVRALGAFDLSPEARLEAAHPLRMFLTTCPDCGGRIKETTTTTCCGGVTDPRGPQDVLACEDCNERLFTFPA